MTSPSHSIALLVCYFGQRPHWADAFLASCRHNTDIDFWIYSDCFQLEPKASNIHIIPTSPEEIETRAREKLGLEISLVHPMKVCDLRPAMGILFSEDLQGYDFWGHIDTDIIFGRIRHFITEDLLNSFDVLSTRAAYMSGPCSFFRNSPTVNNLFQRTNRYYAVFSDPTYQNFDECHFNWHALLKQESPKPGHNFTEIVQEAEKQGLITLYMEDLVLEYVDLPSSYWLFWSEGQLYNLASKKEVMYHHFHAAKKSPLFSIRSSLSTDCLISKTGIHPASDSFKHTLHTSATLKIS